MYAIVFAETLFLLLAFLLFYKFKLNTASISKLFNGITLYLPLTDQDFEQLVELRKSKDRNANGIVRSCEVSEYSQKTKEQTFFNFNFILTFFLCNIFVIVLNEAKNLVLVIANAKEGEVEASFNIIASFSFATFLYFVYLFMKDTLRAKMWSYDAKVFYAAFTIGSAVFFLIELLHAEALGMNLESVNSIVNDRFEKIMEKASDHYQLRLFSTQGRLQVFYAAVFGLFIGILFKSSMRLAYFDNFLLLTEAKQIQIDKTFNYKRIALCVKLKIILNVFLVCSLVDSLVKAPLKFFMGRYHLVVFLFIYLSALLCEMALGAYTLWYDAFFFHMKNYTEVVSFASKGTKESLFSHRFCINYMNTFFWELMQHMFSLIFYPVLLALIQYSRSQMPQYLYERIAFKSKFVIESIQLKAYFFENVTYVIALAFAVSKGVISNANVVYMRLTHQLHNSIY